MDIFKKIIFALFLIFIPNISNAQYLNTKWEVIDFVGETWFSNPDKIVGGFQYFFKGFSEGVFYSCDYAGQSKTYTEYDLDEFLKNKEFKLFQKYKNQLHLKKETIYVHRITCNGKKDVERKVMYPFVTFDNWNRGFYLYEGAIFILEYFEGEYLRRNQVRD